MIPGDIPELDSLVVYEKELRSDFFSNVAAGCLEPSRERKKKNRHKSRNKDESHDLIKSITDFVIPGDVPAIDSLMVFDNNFFSDFLPIYRYSRPLFQLSQCILCGKENMLFD